ncbi:hypothetical protein F4804DRAFT_311149 [Jackrogersella minutella]|nr:hypothetical protein F4804DRAFT_311149 [Jackrogersella minutella]
MSISQTKATPTNDAVITLEPPSSSPTNGEAAQVLREFSENEEKMKAMQLAPRNNVPLDAQVQSHSSPPSFVDKNNTEEKPTRPTSPDTLGPNEIIPKRRINGIWDPSQATDITVHLRMSVQEDIDECLEEFYRLQRLGNFVLARQFFTRNLQDHLERPQVLFGFAEMLLEQGDYKTLSKIGDDTLRNAYNNLVDSGDRILLAIYWELIRVFTAHHNPGMSGVLSRKHDVVDRAIKKLHETIDANGISVTSTEIKMLALLYRLSDLTGASIRQRLQEQFPSKFHEALYRSLLREGRVWDYRDIVVATVSSLVDITKDWDGIWIIIKDWSCTATNASTTLALLDVLMSLAAYELENSTENDSYIEALMKHSMPLALSIIETDPDSMKSRSFIRWMLLRAQFADNKGPHYAYSYGAHFESWPGIVFRSKRLQLPQYIPLHVENPGWVLNGAAAKFERPVRMAKNISRELGDYQTEAMALQRLIVLSGKPDNEFEELCNLQKRSQGDICGYSKTLVSKYLISNTENLRQDLKLEISRLFDIPDFCDCLSMLDSWVLNMLQYSLEGRGPAAEGILKGADEDYRALPVEYQIKIDKKFPEIKRRAHRSDTRLPEVRLKDRFGGDVDYGTRQKRPEAEKLDGGKIPQMHDELKRQKKVGKGENSIKSGSIDDASSYAEDDSNYEPWETEDSTQSDQNPRITPQNMMGGLRKGIKWEDTRRSPLATSSTPQKGRHSVTISRQLDEGVSNLASPGKLVTRESYHAGDILYPSTKESPRATEKESQDEGQQRAVHDKRNKSKQVESSNDLLSEGYFAPDLPNLSRHLSRQRSAPENLGESNASKRHSPNLNKPFYRLNWGHRPRQNQDNKESIVVEGQYKEQFSPVDFARTTVASTESWAQDFAEDRGYKVSPYITVDTCSYPGCSNRRGSKDLCAIHRRIEEQQEAKLDRDKSRQRLRGDLALERDTMRAKHPEVRTRDEEIVSIQGRNGCGLYGR